MPPRRFAFALAILLAAPATFAVEPPGSLDAAPATATESPPAATVEGTRSRLERAAETRVHPRLVVVSDSGRPVARGVPISLSVKDADLVEVLRSFARIAGWNLVVDPSVRGTVTAELVDVPWDHALAVILKTHGLGMELDGRVITVAQPARLYPSPR